MQKTAFFDLSIPLRFRGDQPSAFGVEPANAEVCEYGDIVGDTRRGGSVNFERYTLIPHCNGTHTECVGHITSERIYLRDCLQDVIIPAIVVSVVPQIIDGEPIITKKSLTDSAALSKTGETFALIVRTLPNDESKLSQVYGTEDDGAIKIPPYFSPEAMHYMVEIGVVHLLCDMPSIDRMYDDGKLENHRIFWNVEQGSRNTSAETRINSTITELIYVTSEVADGKYLLNLQIAPFESDAAPSRPILF